MKGTRSAFRPGDMIVLAENYRLALLYALPDSGPTNQATGGMIAGELALVVSVLYDRMKPIALVVTSRLELGWLLIEKVRNSDPITRSATPTRGKNTDA